MFEKKHLILKLWQIISTLDEAINADKLGFDYIGTTLHGYTSYTKGHILYENNFNF